MPFTSKAQQGFMFMHHPDIAKRWAQDYGVPKDLPEHVGNKLKERFTKKGKGK